MRAIKVFFMFVCFLLFIAAITGALSASWHTITEFVGKFVALFAVLGGGAYLVYRLFS